MNEEPEVEETELCDEDIIEMMGAQMDGVCAELIDIVDILEGKRQNLRRPRHVRDAIAKLELVIASLESPE